MIGKKNVRFTLGKRGVRKMCCLPGKRKKKEIPCQPSYPRRAGITRRRGKFFTTHPQHLLNDEKPKRRTRKREARADRVSFRGGSKNLRKAQKTTQPHKQGGKESKNTGKTCLTKKGSTRSKSG